MASVLFLVVHNCCIVAYHQEMPCSFTSSADDMPQEPVHHVVGMILTTIKTASKTALCWVCFLSEATFYERGLAEGC